MFDFVCCSPVASEQLSEQLTVHATIRRRVAHDEPIGPYRNEQETASNYESGRDAIRARLADDELVTSWRVDR